ncbi:MAG: hypothetical protein NVSMB13_16580 [Mycobacteriales bacterium]
MGPSSSEGMVGLCRRQPMAAATGLEAGDADGGRVPAAEVRAQRSAVETFALDQQCRAVELEPPVQHRALPEEDCGLVRRGSEMSSTTCVHSLVKR